MATQTYKHPVQPRLKHRAEAALARGLFAVLRRLPIDAASAFGARLGRGIGPLTSAQRTAARNLARAMPELTPETRTRVLLEMWENFGRTMMEYAVLPRLAHMSDHDLAARLTVEGHEPLAALAAQGKPAVLFGGHIANWEVMPLVLARAAKQQVIVYRPANNPLVDKIIGDVRAPYTAGMAPKGALGARQMLKALAANEHLIMLVDQKINTGLPAPFFGRDAFTGPAVARMAMRYDCPVFPVRTQRLDGCRFKVTVEEPWRFPPDGTDADVAKALARVNARLEEWIRVHPHQWMWMHKRWPD